MNNKSRNNLFKYYGVVAVYFLIMFISSKFNLPNEKIIIAYLVIIPMIIACYLVFTISIITNNIENN